jgi:hypothetical protein
MQRRNTDGGHEMTPKTLQIASFSTGFPVNLQHPSGLIGLVAETIYEASIRHILRAIFRAQ